MGTIIITGNKGNGGGLPPQQKIDVAAEGIKFSHSTFENVPEIFDFSNVTDFSYIFDSCKALNSLPPNLVFFESYQNRGSFSWHNKSKL